MFGLRFWGLSAVCALGTALLIGIPTVLIPNTLFVRMTPTSPRDYSIWGLTVLLIAPLLALASLSPVSERRETLRAVGTGSGRTFAGGVLSFLAVGCPICNKIIVLLLGVTGAMTYFDPIRPLLGVASLLILSGTLLLRVRALRAEHATLQV